MEFDAFFSICQTDVHGTMPDEATMFRNFFEQVELADELGFGTAWVAESHLSSEVRKRNRQPVVPHWQGEVGLNRPAWRKDTFVPAPFSLRIKARM